MKSSRRYNLTLSPFHDGGRYHLETSQLIFGANQWTGFCMLTASVMKGLSAKPAKWSNTLWSYRLKG